MAGTENKKSVLNGKVHRASEPQHPKRKQCLSPYLFYKIKAFFQCHKKVTNNA